MHPTAFYFLFIGLRGDPRFPNIQISRNDERVPLPIKKFTEARFGQDFKIIYFVRDTQRRWSRASIRYVPI